ncbi:MAG: hypothetical protein ACI857_002193 [Arenicella sp.]|jgi:hypothetical protein
MNVKISDNVTKDIGTVYQSIIKKESLCAYFTSDSSADLDAGARVIWEWKDYNAKCEVFDIITKENEFIQFNWSAAGAMKTVKIELTSITDNQTKITITESEFGLSEEDVKAMLRQTQGWTNFASCLKAFLYTGINLRK